MSDQQLERSRWQLLWAIPILVCLAVLIGIGLPYLQRFTRLQSDPVETEAGSLDFSDAIVPLDELQSGGPPKDGIPALTNPAVLAAQRALYLADDDRVIGVVLGGEARVAPPPRGHRG